MGSQSILYRVSQNRFSVRHPIQSEKYGNAKSHMSTGFVPYFKDGLPYLFHSFRNKYFNKISLGNMLYFQNKL